MKGIYLTEEGKKEIEAKITELRIINLELEKVEKHIRDKYWDWNCLTNSVNKKLYEEILSSATILPVEESWYKVIENVENDSQSLILQTPFIMKSLYEQGVIIKPKE
jgi:hypothetical protein